MPCEIDLVLTNPPSNLYTGVQAWATFTNVNAPPVTVYGSLLSGTTFRFRFNPVTDGTWSYTFFSNNGNAYVTNGPGQTFDVPASTREAGFVRREESMGYADRIVYDCAYDGPNQCPPDARHGVPAQGAAVSLRRSA